MTQLISQRKPDVCICLECIQMMLLQRLANARVEHYLRSMLTLIVVAYFSCFLYKKQAAS